MDFTISKHLRALVVAEFVIVLLLLTFMPIIAEGGQELFLSVVEACLYGTLLGFLFEETRVCRDPLIRAVLIIAAISFVIYLLSSISEACGYFKEKSGRTDSRAVSVTDSVAGADVV